VAALAVACAITTAAGALMVSRLAYFGFKDLSAQGRISFTYILVIPLTFVMIALNPPVVIFVIACTYASSGPLLAVWRWRRRRERRRAEAGAARHEG
jgi:CDP-diacylglycerol--serine O-phosphatidyltransferase